MNLNFVGCNQICQIKCFNKLSVPFIKAMWFCKSCNYELEKNPFTEVKSLARSKLNNNKI